MADLVVLADDWGELPSSTQHLMTNLMKKHRIIWVNTIGIQKPKLSIRRMFRIFRKTAAISQDSTDLHPHIVNPKMLPFHGINTVRKINKYLLQKSITEAINALDLHNIILWVSLPTATDIVGTLGERASIYYCCDDIDALDGFAHPSIKPMEKELISKVDLTLVVNRQLAHKLPDGNTLILPHGVDYPLFSTLREKPIDLPDTGPIAGFYGSLSAHLDVEMLAQSATALPKWQFVFIGDIEADVSSLQELPNVHFLGPKIYSQLPAYVQNWDVALLPFHLNRQIDACNPLILKEYLASGTPIASISFPAVTPYSDYIAIQKNKEPFSRVIQRANEQALKARSRQKQVMRESWSYRANQLEELIIHLDKKQLSKNKLTKKATLNNNQA
ncbi:hypothetical protein ACH42_12700 [Endozoicomonas sp. (ex Bugula neritina AB1)]|nr:hypothetical protein ACH42_12700 [Endozoicomonas sp. (ex Bugula neritina AB1)]